MKKSLFFICLFFAIGKLSAQTESIADSLSEDYNPYARNFFGTSLNKLLSTYQLHSYLWYQQQVGDFSFAVKENFSSTLVKSNEKSIKDEHFFSFLPTYKINEWFSQGFSVKHSILSDSRKIGINSAQQSSFIFIPNFLPLTNWQVSPFLGYSSNRQIGVHDDGLIYGGESKFLSVSKEGFALGSTVKITEEEILPRKNSIRDFRVSAANHFSNDIGNILSVSYFQTRKDFYYEADSLIKKEFSVVNNIQSRRENNFQFDDSLRYFRFLPNTDLTLHSTVLWRKIFRDTKYKTTTIASQTIFDTEIDELRLDLEGELWYRHDDLQLQMKTAFMERDEKHSALNFDGANQIFYEQRNASELQKNNFTQRTSITVTGIYQLSSKDSISLSLFHNKLTYDTPSSDNFDDRDELLSIMKLRYTRSLNSFFDFFVSTEGTINKLVYISASRSSNNNVNRVLKLQTGGIFKGTRFRSYNAFDVSANYTVYDYEDLNPNYKSYSFRQFGMFDSSSLNLTTHTVAKFMGYIRLSEQGELQWKKFSLRPTRNLEESFLVPQIGYLYGPARFYIGYRQFLLKTYIFSTNTVTGKLTKSLDSYYLSRGPITEIQYVVYKKIELQMKAWYEFVSMNQKPIGEIPNFDFSVLLNL